ncbi:hypothetical protein GCM10007972_24020 [Iodidimonas muriae]|uniref:Multi-ubiquitin domain-containing protein n=1 Tax=Iodidimonas muriae TaxID=261467 RepID=A0ABQ2LFQ1_9PROT|nr:multiubiquitin domain-containing protein [Iodidimonas muriae]GER08776.1 hypothetical protein JCM17843_30860 [Kordiimonadales bacterium JCM 17843]GGO15669.1 hypothetical protein GCM10007972_24020 [Iodidimonas muriae]
MTLDDFPDHDDLSDALREDRALRPTRAYRIRFAQDNLDFRKLDVPDPVPLGRQILTAAGCDPRDGFSLFAILPSGDFEDVRLDEPFDLRARGAERFVAFQTDRDYKFTLDDSQLEWGKPAIGGDALYKLAKVGEHEAIFLQIRGGTDRLLEPDDLVDLTEPGIERFITAPRPATTCVIIVNSRPREVDDRHVTFEDVVKLAFPGSHDTNVVFSMTYRHAASKPHAGELAAGGSVDIKKKGTVFNVTRTVQS